ncbi:MAG: tRNA1(Val) (adenine(37)-N6)-methyltransferase [Oscillospiraceae bacterium]
MIDVLLKKEEKIDDLQLRGLKIIQNPTQFCFGIDAVLLSDYSLTSIKKGANVLDLCSGNGIIPLLLSAKSEAKNITGMEIQADIANMAKRSIEMNELSHKIDFICDNLNNAFTHFGRSSFNNITCNPPYKELGGGIINLENSLTIARHEVKCTLEDIIRVSSELLEPGGKLCMVHRPERLIDIICIMRAYKIEPKRLRFVHPYYNKTANLILLEGTRHGKPKLFLDPPLYVYEKSGIYTKEINEIYER